MFSGKTSEMFRRVRRAEIAKKRFRIFKIDFDNRFDEGAKVLSHDGAEENAVVVNKAEEILDHIEEVDVVGIDEGQFFGPEIIGICEMLADKGIRVIVAGLDTTSERKPFGPMPELMAIAESVCKIKAVCMVCGDDATHTYCKTVKEGDVLVGEKDEYEARCRSCCGK
jgi:thymidine kinase